MLSSVVSLKSNWPLRFSPVSERMMMGPELMVAMSLTTVPWSLALRRLLELPLLVQFCRWSRRLSLRFAQFSSVFVWGYFRHGFITGGDQLECVETDRAWPEPALGRRCLYRAWWHSGRSRWREWHLDFGRSGTSQRKSVPPAALR